MLLHQSCGEPRHLFRGELKQFKPRNTISAPLFTSHCALVKPKVALIAGGGTRGWQEVNNTLIFQLCGNWETCSWPAAGWQRSCSCPGAL